MKTRDIIIIAVSALVIGFFFATAEGKVRFILSTILMVVITTLVLRAKQK